MGKAFLRGILSAAAVIFTFNLLLFNYSRHVILPLLGALFLLALLAGLGDALAALFRFASASFLDRIALGLMGAAAYFFLAGFFGILRRPAILLFFTAALAVLVQRFVFSRQGRTRCSALEGFFDRPLAEYAVFAIPLVYAMLPPTFYDTLVYHLGIPNLYLQSGGFIPTPQFAYANTFIYYEISLVPAVFLGDLVPRLFHFLLAAVFILAVADEAVEHWGVRRRLHLVLALVSLPMTLFLLVTCKNDLPGAIFIFLAIRQHLRRRQNLAAVYFGFAVGIKYFNLLPLAAFLAMTIRPWKRTELRRGMLLLLIVILVVAPLLLKNFRFSGNPFFPFFGEAFPSPFWDPGRFALMKSDVGRMVQSPEDVVRLPYSLSFFNFGYGGLVGPLFLVFLPFLLLGPVRQRKWLFWALLVLACAPFLTASLRFVYVVFVILAIFSVQALDAAGGRMLRAIFFLLVASNLVLGIAMLEKFYQAHTLLSGKFTPAQYQEHFFPTYPALAYLNARAPREAKVLIAGESRNYFLHRPYQVSSALDYCIVKRYLASSRNAGEFISAMRQDGYSFLLVNLHELKRLQAGYTNLTAAEEKKLLTFLAGLEPVFHKGVILLYEFPARPR
jgi:hypothetical protein